MTDHVTRSFHTAVAAGLVPILAEFWSSYEWMFKETTPEFHVRTNGHSAQASLTAQYGVSGLYNEYLYLRGALRGIDIELEE
jgi:hypothetical protein